LPYVAQRFLKYSPVPDPVQLPFLLARSACSINRNRRETSVGGVGVGVGVGERKEL
jgi:hypothetical protein